MLLSLVGGAGLALAALHWQAGAVYLATLLVYLAIGARMAPPALWPLAAVVFSAALLVRTGALLAIQWGLPALGAGSGWLPCDTALAGLAQHMGVSLFRDEWKYEEVAWGIAAWWTQGWWLEGGGGPRQLIPGVHLQQAGMAFWIAAGEALHYLVPHAYLDAAVYAVVGRDPLAARTAQAAIGSLVPVVLAALGRSWFGARVGTLVGWVAVFEPSLVFWSAWMLKEMLVLVLAGLLLLAATRFAARPGLLVLLPTTGLLVVLTESRRPLGIILGLLLPFATLAAGLRGHPARRLAAAAALLLSGSVGLWAAGEGVLGTARLNGGLLDAVAHSRIWGAVGARTAIAADLRFPLPQAAPTPPRGAARGQRLVQQQRRA